MKRIIVFAAALIMCAALALETAVYSMPLRLHIVANSDSALDQSVKLEVRDAVLELSQDIFSDSFSLNSALEAAISNKELFEEKANEILKTNGLDYSAKAQIGEFTFPKRDYGSIIYPAGEYTALRLVLGKGEGHNWWCVMYPSLCYTGRRSGTKKVVMKSALVEWIRRIKTR
ncbi:MAG: stage II sporulation protein R [Christensenellaceae bacterium]|nr:stage II sporulation protein R [Christensenellaceae bacterium]